MHYFLFLRLLRFYARVHPTDTPLVIHREKTVLDVNDAAFQKLVYPGMPLSEAKAILTGAQFVSWQEEPYVEAQEAWLDLCTRFSDVIEPCDQHSAWIDLSCHPDPEALTFTLLRMIFDRTGLRAVPGLGCSKWIAKLAATIQADTADPLARSIQMREPVSRPAGFLSPLKTRMLSPVQPDHRQRLEFLGYSTIGEVAKVPLSVLRGQFGDAATHIRMCARGGYFEPVAACYPPNSLSDRFAFEGAVEDLQDLDRGIVEIGTRIGKRLTEEDRASKQVIVTLEHDGFETTVLRRNFAKPIQNVASAVASLRLLVKTEKPVIAMRVRLENVKASQRIQRELTGRTTAGDRERGAMAAFQHIRTVFGDDAIQTGNELIEPRRKQVLRAWKDATGWA